MRIEQLKHDTFQLTFNKDDITELTRYANAKLLKLPTVIYNLMMEQLDVVSDYITTNSGD